MNRKIRLKKGDTVKIISGKFKDKIGVIGKIMISNCTCYIEGVTVAKKHKKASSNDQNSGIVEVPQFINISNVSYFDNENSATSKISYIIKDGKKHRFLKKFNKILDLN